MPHLHFSFLHLVETAAYLAIIRYVALATAAWLGADSVMGQAVATLLA